MSERVRGYIDGFNLYFGLKSKKWRRFYWLDAWKLVENLLKPHQVLSGVTYFTARVTGSGGSRLRQKALLEAYDAMGQCELRFGKFLSTTYRCRSCGAENNIPSEKMSDVNIAMSLLSDAVQDLYDTAILVSGDSDLAPAVREVKRLYPEKRILVALPPGRFSRLLTQVADGYLAIGRAKLSASQLPESIEHRGKTLRRPERWR